MALLFCSMILYMKFSQHPILKWLPAVLMMVAIFVFSATPSRHLQYDLLRHMISKSGHVIGYAMLTLSYWRALNFSTRNLWVIWLFVLLYAATDEFHQSFVPGRHPAAFDVLVYDNAGALIALWTTNRLTKQKQPIRGGVVVERFTTIG